MITGKPKPIKELAQMVADAEKILVVGCGGCVTVHCVGGEREAEVTASLLRLVRQQDAIEGEVTSKTVERQCEWEFLDQLSEDMKDCEAAVSMACGVGAQGLSDRYPQVRVIPGLDTNMLAMTESPGVWGERCSACGDCLIEFTGGICPVTRCAKSLLNGPCGGSQNGICEVSKETPCAWQLVYDRLKEQGRLDELKEIRKPKDWSQSLSGGPRTNKREDLTI